MESEGTWIDWQYLLDAANLLAKCRYTLKYTYPYAYYMEAGSRKELVSLLVRHRPFFVTFKIHTFVFLQLKLYEIYPL